jgi:hypothetical protein
VTRSDTFSKPLLEALRFGSGCQPKIQDGGDARLDLLGAIDLARYRNGGLARYEWPRRVFDLCLPRDQCSDLVAALPCSGIVQSVPLRVAIVRCHLTPDTTPEYR